MATYYVDGVDGDDANDGLGEGSGSAWATIDKAMNTVSAGDTVFVKANTNYNELATIDTAGTTTAPILFVGYSSTANRTDRGQVTIDAEDTRGQCVADSLGSVAGFYVFENFKFINATGSGVALSLAQCVFRNCEFNDNGAHGLIATNGLLIESCVFSGNSSNGADGGTACSIVGCSFLNNTQDGIEITYGTVSDCVFYNNDADAISFLGSNGFPCVVLGCTIDGNAKATAVGIQFPGSFWGPFIAINNIIYDCSTGMSGHNNGGGRFIGRNNLMNSNTTDYGNAGYETLVGEVTSAPGFSDEAAQDYTLGGSSPALNAGFDAYEVRGATQLRDIGAHESTAGGSSGGVSPSKRAGKQ